MKLKCGCDPKPGMQIVTYPKLTTMFAPAAIACYKGQKAKIISAEPWPGWLGAQVELDTGQIGHILTDKWVCNISCQAFQEWLLSKD